MNLTTTIGHIKSFNPCQKGIDKLIDSIPGCTDNTEVSLRYIFDNNGMDDVLWVLRVWDYREYCLLCADIAESVLYIFEDVYPNDLRPREAIEAVRKYHRGEISKQDLNDVHNAANVALGAADIDAYVVAHNDAVSRAVAYTARAAARAARAAANAASTTDAAYAAYNADAAVCAILRVVRVARITAADAAYNADAIRDDTRKDQWNLIKSLLIKFTQEKNSGFTAPNKIQLITKGRILAVIIMVSALSSVLFLSCSG